MKLLMKQSFHFGFRKIKSQRGFISAPQMRKERRLKAFTLVELLVVIMLITLLSSVVYASYTRALAMGRDGRRKTDLASLRDALELYYSEINSYISTNGAWANAGTALTGLTTPVVYIQQIPSDPKAGWSGYRYYSPTGGQSYCIAARLETTTSIQNTCASGVPLEANYIYRVGNP